MEPSPLLLPNVVRPSSRLPALRPTSTCSATIGSTATTEAEKRRSTMAMTLQTRALIRGPATQILALRSSNRTPLIPQSLSAARFMISETLDGRLSARTRRSRFTMRDGGIYCGISNFSSFVFLPLISYPKLIHSFVLTILLSLFIHQTGREKIVCFPPEGIEIVI